MCGEKGRLSDCTNNVCVGKADRVLSLINISVWEGVLLLAPINSQYIIGKGTNTHYKSVNL